MECSCYTAVRNMQPSELVVWLNFSHFRKPPQVNEYDVQYMDILWSIIMHPFKGPTVGHKRTAPFDLGSSVGNANGAGESRECI